MTQLLAHLIGDYCLQSHVMATRKTSSWTWAFIHAAFYGLPFLFLLAWSRPTVALLQLAIIVGTHAVIDRLAIARRWCQLYGVGFSGLWVRGQMARAAFQGPPPFLGVWLVIIVDNTFHLCINFATLSVQ